MKKLNVLIVLTMALLLGCGGPAGEPVRMHVPVMKNGLRAPAYPLVTIDPYTSGWSMTDNLYDEPVKHWTGSDFPLVGAVRVDGQVYRFMGTEGIPLIPIAKMAETEKWTGRYTLAQPAKEWVNPDFNDAAWKEGQAAFGTPEETAVNTHWLGENTRIWVRRTVEVDRDLTGENIYLEYSHDDDIEIYINGVEVVNTGFKWNKNVFYKLTPEQAKLLKPGRNVVAASCLNRRGGALLDLGLNIEAKVDHSLATTAVQKSVDVQATQTHYMFTCGPVDLQVSFVAPLLMDDLQLISRPVNYIAYTVLPTDGKAHDVQVYFEASPKWAIDKANQETVCEKFEQNNMLFLKAGSKTQELLGKKGDNVRIDWGYFYLSAGKDNATYTIGDEFAMRSGFAKEGKLGDVPATRSGGHNHMGISQDLGKVSQGASGKVLIGYDDLYSVQYFGENLRPYWNKSGDKDIVSAFTQAAADFDELKKRCNEFDDELMRKTEAAGGRKYAELCALAYRQSISAHKLAEAPNGDLLFLSKENFSNGSIGTVDITYPSSPLYLMYNLDLVKGLMNHIFYYSESGKWTKPFPSHDIGTYPIGNGQTYGGDMPVEESGNMLVLTAALATMEGNAEYARKHWDVLTVWTDYLVEKGLDPENQLCTDDFAGHFAHNTNLSVKAIMGIASYGRMAKMLGKDDVAEKYTAKAREMAAEWVKMADDGDHFRLTFDKPGTWSQKYNLVWDKLMKLDIFPSVVVEKEIPFYLTKQNEYGLPLDNRMSYTKSDWVVWTATLAPTKAEFEQFIAPIHKFYSETVDRVPMSDWFETDGKHKMNFQARSVVGGYFIKALEEEIMSKN